MQVGLFANKIGMTQIFGDAGALLPVTVLKPQLCRISQIKSVAIDGYNAVQLAYGECDFLTLNKSKRGHLKKAGGFGSKFFGEFCVSQPDDFALGQIITVDTFKVGQKVRIMGKGIGKGFAGNQKRHHFSRGPMTHGSKNHRLPGSIGAGSTPGRVYPGKKMSGQLGNQTVTIKSLEILYIGLEDNILVVKGSVPGKRNALLKIQPQKH